MTATVQKVLPLWQAVFPNDDVPHKALETSVSYLQGCLTESDIKVQLSSVWEHCDALCWRHADSQNVIAVGYAAAQVIREAASERHFGCDSSGKEASDSEVSPLDHDAAFCASIAYAGGAPTTSTSDGAKRLEFWLWWLRAASDLLSRATVDGPASFPPFPDGSGRVNENK
jgi:hypothetical protein